MSKFISSKNKLIRMNSNETQNLIFMYAALRDKAFEVVL